MGILIFKVAKLIWNCWKI